MLLLIKQLSIFNNYDILKNKSSTKIKKKTYMYVVCAFKWRIRWGMLFKMFVYLSVCKGLQSKVSSRL